MREENQFQKSDTVQMDIYLQYAGKQALISDLTNAVQAQYESFSNTEEKIKFLEIYLKPEDEKVYFVADRKYIGECPLFNA